MDLASGCFGEIMGEILAYRRDEWEEQLRRMGFFLGKFIYLMDAYEDMEKDAKSGSYNVFLLQKEEMADEAAFEKEAYDILKLMMAECSRTFEQLPIIENTEILRNILYSGVWCRYEMVQRKRKQEMCIRDRTSNDMTHRGFSLERILYGLWFFLFQPPQLSAKFPYLNGVLLETDYLGKMVTESSFGGVFLCSLFFVPMLFLRRYVKSGAMKKELLWFTGVCVFLSVLIGRCV